MTKLNRLQSLYTDTQSGSCTIIIPDLTTPTPQTWSAPSSKPWIPELKKRGTIGGNYFVFAIHQEPAMFSWKQLQRYSEELLFELRILYHDKSAILPLHFISLGFGGTILKLALISANSHQDNCAHILDAIAGITFLVTPHITSSDDSGWQILANMSRIRDRNSDKIAFSRDEINKMAQTCQQFEDIALDRPILVAYEKQETVVHNGLFSRRRLLIIGRSRSMIETSSKVEELAIDSDFASAHALRIESVEFEAINRFVKTSSNAAQLRLKPGNDGDAAIPAHISDECTVRTHSVFGDVAHVSSTSYERSHATSSTSDLNMLLHNLDLAAACRKAGRSCKVIDGRTKNKLFFGRRDILHDMERILLPPNPDDALVHHGLRMFSIYSHRSVGKTELASQFMFRNMDAFDNIFWLQADQTTTLKQAFSRLAIDIGLETAANAEMNQTASAELVHAWLKKPLIEKKVAGEEPRTELANWLIIFDNFGGGDLTNFLPPITTNGSILFTSRDRLWENASYSEMPSIELLPLSIADGASLLTQLIHRHRHGSATTCTNALQVARLLGGFPLDLTQLAGLVNGTVVSLDDFLLEYDERSRSTTSQSDIASAIVLEHLDPGSSTLLDIIAVLNVDDIGEEILDFTARTADGNDMLLLFPVGSTDECNSYELARNELIKRSLVTRKDGQARLRMHRQTQDAVLDNMSIDRLQHIFTISTALLRDKWPFPDMSQRHSLSRWRVCERYVAHVMALYGLYVGRIKPAGLLVPTATFALLLIDTAGYFHERGISEEQNNLLECAKEISEAQEDGAEKRNLLSHLYYIRGAQAAECNDRKMAYKYNNLYLNTRLAIARSSARGRKDVSLAHAYNQAGNVRLDVKDIKGAIEYYLESIRIYKAIAIRKEVDYSIPIANLGCAYWLDNNLDTAVHVLQQSLDARKRSYGHDDAVSFRTGRLLHIFGNVRASQGDLEEAFDLHCRALTQYRKTLGREHHRTADLYHKVAEHHYMSMQYKAARILAEEARKIYDGDSRKCFKQELARTTFLLASILSCLHLKTESVQAREEAFRIYHEIVPDDGRRLDELQQHDFDEIVTYASR